MPIDFTPTSLNSNINFTPATTVPNVANQAQPQSQDKGIIGNAFSDIGGIFNSLIHPINTIKTLGQVALGGGEALAGHITGKQPTGGNYQTFENAANSFLGGALKGNFSGAAKKATSDPFGFALDLSSILDLGGGALGAAGKLGDVSKLSDIGKAARTAGEAVNPVGAAVKGAGALVGKVGSKIEAPFASSFNPAVEDTAKLSDVQSGKILGEDAGTVSGKMPVSSQTNSKVLQMGESIASKGLFGQKIIDNIKQVNDTLNQRVNDIVDKLKTENLPSKESIGKDIQSQLQTNETGFRNLQDKVYENFSKKVNGGAIPAVTTQTESMLKQLIHEGGQDLYKGINPRFGKMLEKITGSSASGLGGSSDFLKRNPGVSTATALTFENLKQTATSIGQEIGRTDDPALRRLYGAMREDLNSTVIAKDPVLGPGLQKITNDYKTGIGKINDNLIQGIQKSNPANIVDNLLNKKTFSSDTLAKLKEHVPQQFEQVKQTFTNQLLEKSQTRSTFDVAKFEKNLGQVSPEALDQLYSPAEQSTLNQAVEAIRSNKSLLESMKPTAKISEGSQTAYLVALGSQGLTLLADLARGDVSGVAKALVGEMVLPKAFATDIGKKFLTTGTKFSKGAGAKIAKQATRVGKVAKVGNIVKESNSP